MHVQERDVVHIGLYYLLFQASTGGLGPCPHIRTVLTYTTNQDE